MNGQVEKYERYKTIAQFSRTSILSEFDKLVYSSPFVSLEFSSKIQQDHVLWKRINVWWHRNPQKSFRAILKFIDSVNHSDGSLHLDSSPVRPLMSLTSTSEVKYVILGIDEREHRADSRVKVWAIVRNDGKRLEDLAQEFPDLSGWGEILTVFRVDDIAYGVELYFDGRTTRRGFYGCLHGDQIADAAFTSRLKSFFADPIMDLITASRQVEVSLRRDSKRILHFHPIHADLFLRCLDNELINEVDKLFCRNGYQLNVVSLVEAEICEGRPRNINLYYV
ncbi:MAG: DUF5838 family protein [Candidatus Bathyarchaeia archaeon]